MGDFFDKAGRHLDGGRQDGQLCDQNFEIFR